MLDVPTLLLVVARGSSMRPIRRVTLLYPNTEVAVVVDNCRLTTIYQGLLAMTAMTKSFVLYITKRCCPVLLIWWYWLLSPSTSTPNFLHIICLQSQGCIDIITRRVCRNEGFAFWTQPATSAAQHQDEPKNQRQRDWTSRKVLQAMLVLMLGLMGHAAHARIRRDNNY